MTRRVLRVETVAVLDRRAHLRDCIAFSGSLPVPTAVMWPFFTTQTMR
jgi:hypothetical protein